MAALGVGEQDGVGETEQCLGLLLPRWRRPHRYVRLRRLIIGPLNVADLGRRPVTRALHPFVKPCPFVSHFCPPPFSFYLITVDHAYLMRVLIRVVFQLSVLHSSFWHPVFLQSLIWSPFLV